MAFIASSKGIENLIAEPVMIDKAAQEESKGYMWS